MHSHIYIVNDSNVAEIAVCFVVIQTVSNDEPTGLTVGIKQQT
jgi:hypothetical protein